MENQRICIIGDGLSGLTSAIAINNLKNIDVHLIARKSKKIHDNRTTAISESNLKFLKDNISNLNTKIFWPSKSIQLYYETKNEKINFLNIKEKNKSLMHVYKNEKFKKILLKELKIKKIKVIHKEIKNLNKIKNYDLVILCLGSDSKIYDKITNFRSINKDYKEIAVTGHVKHKLKKINTSQFFLKEGPLAILPFSKNSFSFVWSLNNFFYKKNIKTINHLIKNKVKNILKIKHSIKIENLQSYPIKLGLKREYHSGNILILGEGLHTVHPVAGQGFNLILRDVKKLKEILGYYSSLGIALKNSDALNDFYLQRKPENIIFGLGIDVTHKFFKKNKFLDPIKELFLKNISENRFIKKISKTISNQGLSK